MIYGLAEQALRCNENCIKIWAQRVVISSTKSSWRPVTGGVYQGSILSPILFKTFNNDLYDGTDHTFSKLADDIKLGVMADMPEGSAVVQRNLARLE